MKVAVNNPILPGFNPDPSMIYVDETFYVATSTFEYYPGVQIHYSKDLIHWKHHGVLGEKRLLNLTGIPHSGGIWAPCLRYHEEEKLFYLLYTNFKSSYTPPFRDQDNYLITAPSIFGPWSDPVRFNASGYDPAIFFDDDGKAYITNMIWDYRARADKMSAGIILQEYDWKKRQMVGDYQMIFEGTDLGQTEGPSIYKRNGWYYLMTAEGGPHYEHVVTLARSKNIWGPYEVHPDNYVLQSKDSELQKAGHASICCDKNGHWYMAYLCARPLSDGRCTMGRETAIQRVEWREDDWLYTRNTDASPDEVLRLNADEAYIPEHKKVYTFDNDSFMEDFLTLREPLDNGRFSLTDRPGYLRMYGRESINSGIEQSILVRRQTSLNFFAAAELEFEPKKYGHMAGLIYRYDEGHQYYCYMTYDEQDGYVVRTLAIDGFHYDLLATDKQFILSKGHVWLKVEVHGAQGQFYVSENGEDWHAIGEQFDASKLSDDYAIGFTGAMVGMACQDVLYHEYPADFKCFIYDEMKEDI